MCTLVDAIEVQLQLSYRFSVIHGADRIWVRLESPDFPTEIGKTWSAPLARQEVAAGDVIALVIERLRGATDTLNVQEAVRVWPPGWDFWGGGKPMPISNYLSSAKYARDVATLLESREGANGNG